MKTTTRSMAALLALLLLFCLLPLGAFASEEADINTGQEEILLESEELVPEEAPVTEEEAQAEPTPSQDTAVTETEPTSSAAAAVQALIAALPEVAEEIFATEDAVDAATRDYWIARQSYEVLTEEEQTQVDTTKLDELGYGLMALSPALAATTYKQAAWSTQYLSYTITRTWTDNTGASRTAILNRINDHWIYDTSYGHACYCIRPDMGAADSYYYDSGTFAWNDQLSEGQRNLIRLALLYGYPNCSNTNGHSSFHYAAYCQAATQLLIFEVVTKCLDTTAPYRHSSNTWSDAIPYSSAKTSFYQIYWDMLSRIQNDGWLPSWMQSTQAKADQTPIELTYNESTGLYEATLTNTTAKNSTAQYYSWLLDEFSYALPDGVTVTRDTTIGNTDIGQKLTITATPAALASGDIQITVTTPYLVKSSSQSSYPATVYLYGRQYSSSVWYQTMIQVATVQSDPILAYMTLRGDAFGTLQILKTSDDGAVSGIAFTVTNNTTGESQTVTTGTDGSITLDNLVAGSYTVTETVPTAYVNEVSSQTVTVSAGETATVGFLNCLKRFRVQLTKQETDTDIVVADAVYGLYHQGTLVDRYTTDENGQFTTDYYPCGEGWTIQELEAPRGYALDETVYDLSVAPQVFTQASNTVEMSVCDDPIPGSITVLKADSTGKPLAGAVFLLEYSTDGTTWQPVESRTGDIVTLGGCTSPGLTAGQLTTGSDGTVVFIGLRADGFIQYRLTETKAPPGYNLMADTIYQGTLPTQGNSDPLYEIAFTVQDGVTTSLPMTGSNGLWLVTMGTVLAGLAVIAGYFYIIQKEKTK